MDHRTLVKCYVQIIIEKDMGIIVVCSHKNIHVHIKSHFKFYETGIVYQNGHSALIISQASLFHLQTRLLYITQAYRDNTTQ